MAAATQAKRPRAPPSPDQSQWARAFSVGARPSGRFLLHPPRSPPTPARAPAAIDAPCPEPGALHRCARRTHCGNAGKAPEGTTIARSIPMGSCVLCRSPALRAILAPPAPQHHCPPERLPPSTVPSPNQAHCIGAHGAPYPRTRVTGCCGVGCAARTNPLPPEKGKGRHEQPPCPWHPYSLTTYSLSPFIQPTASQPSGSTAQQLPAQKLNSSPPHTCKFQTIPARHST